MERANELKLPRYLTTKEVSDATGIPKHKILALIETRTIKRAHKNMKNRTWLIEESEVDNIKLNNL